ncbi:hypothetical protein [Enterococcus sp. DIV0212c]
MEESEVNGVMHNLFNARVDNPDELLSQVLLWFALFKIVYVI